MTEEDKKDTSNSNEQKQDSLAETLAEKQRDVKYFSTEIPALRAPMPDEDERVPIIQLKNLSIIVFGRTLIDNSNQSFFQGETTLLVGGSGTGKSVVMKTLLGLITPSTPGFEITGEIIINNHDILKSYPSDIRNHIGIVFQDYALFDEFSAKQNLKFAYDHSNIERNSAERKNHMNSLISTLSMNLKTPISKMSGGERRRLAIARTLAFDPKIILYDEPTTGLDPLNAERVAQHISKLSTNYQKTSVVVTHDYEHLREVADKIILIDPANMQLRNLVPAEADVNYVKELLKTQPKAKIKRDSILTRIFRGFLGIFISTSKVFEELLMLFIYPFWWILSLTESLFFKPIRRFAGSKFRIIAKILTVGVAVFWLANLQHFLFGGKYSPEYFNDFLVTKHFYIYIISSLLILMTLLSSGIAPKWKRFSWGIRFFWHYLKISTLSSSVVYIGLAGFIGGFVATFFLYEYFPYRSYTEPLLRDDVLRALGFLSFRVLIPILVTLLIAARSGAAIAADVGNRVYSHQDEALKTFNISPKAYWSSNIFGAFIIGCPILLFVAYATSAVSSGFAFLVTHPEDTLGYWWEMYKYDIFETGKLLPIGFWWMFSKSLVCFMVIALVSNIFGMRKKESSISVSGGITQTIWWSTILVLIVHMLFAFFEFSKYE
ncbi:MAG: ABC transporter permease [Planctomycetes bacterium]|nr:ABC transporter permease [Planctomycetota bacterium]